MLADVTREVARLAAQLRAHYRLRQTDALQVATALDHNATAFVPTTAPITLAPETMPTLQLAGLGLAMVTVGSGVGGLLGSPTLGSILEAGSWTAGSILLVGEMGLSVVFSVLAGWRMKKT